VLFLALVPSTAEVALVLILLRPREVAPTTAATLIVKPRACLDIELSLNMVNGIVATLDVELLATMEVVNQVTVVAKADEQLQLRHRGNHVFLASGRTPSSA
jgi:hypothetical protein